MNEPGIGFIKRVGWEEIEGRREFTALIVFLGEPPDLPCSIVWNAEPVRIVPVLPPSITEKPA